MFLFKLKVRVSRMNRAVWLKVFLGSNPTTSFYSKLTYATFNNRKLPKEESPAVATKKKELQGNRFEIDIQNYVETAQDLSNIHQFRQSIIQQYNSILLTEKTFDAIFMRMCVACRNYNLGKAFLNEITERNKEVNTATLSRFLTLCYFSGRDVADTNEVKNLCNTLLSRSQFLDSNTKESIILGLSITDKWREGLNLLANDETTHHGLAMNAIVDCLVQHDEIDTAISWMDRMLAKERPISDFVYEQLIRKCKVDQNTWSLLSEFLVRNGIFLKQPIIQLLKEMLENHSTECFTGKFTNVDKISGNCRSCRNYLQKASITDEEFAALRKSLMEKVLFGENVFLGSKPEEMKKFQKFIQETAPYDMVIDGLNVAYHVSAQARSQPSKKVEALKSVVKHFTDQNLRVLVLTRKHLLRDRDLRNVQQRALVFSTDNLSTDDPFLLYAAVQSKHTKFLSDDLFRDHIFRLADKRLENIFRIWQHTAQVQIGHFRKNLTAEFHHPRCYRTVAQFGDGCWHIPYDDGTPRFRYQVPDTWLCLQPRIPSSEK